MTTKIKTFKPMLAPNEEANLDEIKYSIFASYKLDGIRCLFIKGEMLSRSLKPIVNKQLREKFQPLIEFSKIENLILDGEIYSPDLTFQDITRYVMTQDFQDKKSVKKHGKILTIPDSLKFYGFDIVMNDNYNMGFLNRFVCIQGIEQGFPSLIKYVKQVNMNCKKDIHDYFEEALENGYEGLILKDGNGIYKCGRGTLKEGLIYKVKPFATFDAEILHVVQATKVNPNAKKKINELGRSVTSKKRGDRILIDKASAFEVDYEGKRLKVVIAMTDEEKEAIWSRRSTYIGKTIEYKGMMIGAKDVPRHPVMIRFREDK